MLKEIEIQNFRCFEKTKINGFERVNLISGKNNAGKTALLEAILLNNSPRPDNVMLLKQIRRESYRFSKTLPENAWDNLFFNQDKSQKIEIITRNELGSSTLLELSVDKSVQNFITQDEEEDDEKFMTLLSSSETAKSVLHLKAKFNEQDSFGSSIIASSKGIIAKDVKVPDVKQVSFIPSFLRIANKDLTEEYDKARLSNKADEILAAFKMIDSSIQQVESFSIGEPTIYLKREGENRLPLSLFGDALNRVADIILRLVNNRSSILLIDEIENGLHYTNQKSFWQILFRLADDLEAQIFATTHSLEMLKAFVAAGLENKGEVVGSHFEMARNPKTQQIIGIKRDIETLDYGIEHGQGVRGE